MPRRLPAVTTLLAALLLLAAPPAPAATITLERQIVVEWGLASGPRETTGTAPVLRTVVFRPGAAPILRIRMLLTELALLPGRPAVVTLRISRAAPPPPEPEARPVLLPLPGAMPLLLGALMGFLVLGRRRRAGPGLVRGTEAT